MHLHSDLAEDIPYRNGDIQKIQISEEAELFYYELIKALEEEETVSFVLARAQVMRLRVAVRNFCIDGYIIKMSYSSYNHIFLNIFTLFLTS